MARLTDWQLRLARQAYAYGPPDATAGIKQRPEHFKVTELMDVEPSGTGEHCWLWVRKCKHNTDRLAKSLARHAGVPYRDVGYSGLKDYFAVTRQWFSVRQPGGTDDIWDDFSLEGVQIERAVRHGRKIKRGTHRGNRFEIVATDLAAERCGLEQKLSRLSSEGVPNYFGAQRFGRAAQNMQQTVDFLAGVQSVKDRNLRSILLSAARAWLFNTIVSARISDASWNRLYPGEPANLDGSGSTFISDGRSGEQARLSQLDIHPTAPMWGDVDTDTTKPYQQLHDWEVEQLKPFKVLMDGLVAHGLKYQRRPIRCKASALSWQFEQSQLMLKFELQRGQYATSVLRELISA